MRRARLIATSTFTLAAALLFVGALTQARSQSQGPEVTVYKSASCGCCAKWVEHMKANGFRVTAHDVPDIYDHKHGVPERLQSCHTALVDGYVIEGHVPASDIQRLLKEKPKAKGLAVPGMPMGSPGMEGAWKDTYSVLLMGDDWQPSVYREYKGDR